MNREITESCLHERRLIRLNGQVIIFDLEGAVVEMDRPDDRSSLVGMVCTPNTETVLSIVGILEGIEIGIPGEGDEPTPGLHTTRQPTTHSRELSLVAGIDQQPGRHRDVELLSCAFCTRIFDA